MDANILNYCGAAIYMVVGIFLHAIFGYMGDFGESGDGLLWMYFWPIMIVVKILKQLKEKNIIGK